jgi:hypothetical protein
MVPGLIALLLFPSILVSARDNYDILIIILSEAVVFQFQFIIDLG